MSELPRGWREVVLADVADSCLGKMLDRQKHIRGSALPYLRNQNVRWFSVDDSDLMEMLFEEHELERYGLRAGDVLVCEGGEPGRAAIWDGRLPVMKFQKAIHRVRPSSVLLPEWLVFRLWHDAQAGRLGKYFTGTTIKHFTGTALARFELPLPPLNEQRRIVAKLDSLQERSRRARDSLDAVPALLDKLRQSILAAAFRGDLTRDFREKHKDLEPASKLLQRIRTERRKKWEEAELAKLTAKGKPPTDDKWKSKYKEPDPVDTTGLPKLPDGWCWASVEELSTKVVDGVHKKPNYVTNGIPFLTVKNLTAGPGISFDEVNYITVEDHEEYIKRTDPELGDLLISKDGTLGVTRLVRTETTFSIFVSLALVKPVLRTMGVYLEAAFQSPFFQERFKATGSGLLHIHLVDLRAAALPIAPLAEQELVAERAREALARLDATALYNQELLASLGSLDRAILAKAFRGELVPQDPSDEPADVMLARTTASPTPAREKRGRRPGAKESHPE